MKYMLHACTHSLMSPTYSVHACIPWKVVVLAWSTKYKIDPLFSEPHFLAPVAKGAGPPLNVGDPPTGLSYFYGSQSTHHWAAASSL